MCNSHPSGLEAFTMWIGIFVVLLALWLIFWLGVHITGAFIHILLVLAIIALILHFVRGSSRRV